MLVFDLLLISLLGGCIWYCYTISQDLKQIKNSKEQFETIFKNLDLYISKANKTLQELNTVSGENISKLSNLTEKAEVLSNDLVFITEIGTSILDKLENSIKEAREIIKKNTEQLEGAKKDYHNEEGSEEEDIDDYYSQVKTIHSFATKAPKDNENKTKSSVNYFDTLKKLNKKS